jgi:hypothetical protein
MKGLIVGLLSAVFVTIVANTAINHDRDGLIRATKKLTPEVK